MKYDQVLELNGVKLTSKYIESLNKQERLDLIDPIFDIVRKVGWLYPDEENKIKKSWGKVKEYQPDLNADDQFNNSSLGTDICKFYCHSFFDATEPGAPTMKDNFNDDKILKKMIWNRLGLAWLDADSKGEGVNEAFNLSFKMIAIQAQRSMRLINQTSIFKPSIAKFMALKYSMPGDVIGDYSCGFGARLMGAVSCGRQYIGTDPMTCPELEIMAAKLGMTGYKLIQSGSEDYRGDENSIDLYYSSPPYMMDSDIIKESYTNDVSQAYNKGKEYFYNTYWDRTLDNVKYMLKPGKWFGLNLTEDCSEMIRMANDKFGKPIEIVKLKTIRSHLSKTAGTEKFEPVFMYKNIK